MSAVRFIWFIATASFVRLPCDANSFSGEDFFILHSVVVLEALTAIMGTSSDVIELRTFSETKTTTSEKFHFEAKRDFGAIST